MDEQTPLTDYEYSVFQKVCNKYSIVIVGYNKGTGQVVTTEGKKSLDRIFKKIKDGLVELYSDPEYSEHIAELTKMAKDSAYRVRLVLSLIEKFKVREVKASGGNVQEVAESLKNFKICINISDPEDRRLVSPDFRIAEGYSADIYQLANSLTEEEVYQSSIYALFKYAPRTSERFYKQEDDVTGETSVLNTYNPPKWANIDPSSVPDELPDLFRRIVEHLVPIEEEREYLYDWMYNSMTNRSRVYLVLCGHPGIGKTTIKDVLRALHGKSNFIYGKKSTLTSNFNSQLSQGTLISFDELNYTAEEENVMKEIPNGNVSIERKGIDANRGSEMHASLLINNNKPRDNYLDFDSRKFVPLTLNTERLETSLSSEEITEFYSKIDVDKETMDLEYIAQIGYWILRHGKSDKWPNGEYKSKMFYTICHTSLAKWKKKVITLLRKRLNEECTCSELEELFNKETKRSSLIFPDYTTVQYFLQIYRDFNGNKVYEVEEMEDDSYNDFIIREYKPSPLDLL